jgi:hypothetical protein
MADPRRSCLRAPLCADPSRLGGSVCARGPASKRQRRCAWAALSIALSLIVEAAAQTLGGLDLLYICDKTSKLA